jgi:hypothetical protein
MSIRIYCSQCGQGYRVKEHLAGSQVRCRACGAPIEVPQEEHSPGGGTVYRHTHRVAEPEPVAGDSESIEAISEHIQQHLGEVDFVYHELVSDLVHVDLHVVAPRPDRNYYTIVTSGMSDRPMNTPEGAEEYRFAELLICLPPDWPLDREALEDERLYWPLRWLKIMARFPHEYDTWLFLDHTLPNGDPAEPFAANTQMCCWLLTQPLTTSDAFDKLELGPAKTVYFLAAVPLYREEMELKLNKGVEQLYERFNKVGVNEVLNLARKNTCKRRFGWF